MPYIVVEQYLESSLSDIYIRKEGSRHPLKYGLGLSLVDVYIFIKEAKDMYGVSKGIFNTTNILEEVIKSKEISL